MIWLAHEILITPDNFRSLLTNISNVDFGGTTNQFIQVNKKHNNLELPCDFENLEIETQVLVVQGTGPYLIQLYGRGGHHSDKAPCEGCAIKARFRETHATNVKELYHTSGRGYTDNRVMDARPYPSILGRWTVLKVRIMNEERDDVGITPTTIEEYVDNILVGSYVDSGGWATEIQPPPDCSRRQFDATGSRCADEILNRAGSLVTMRSDGDTVYRFKYIRVREA